MIVVEKRGKQKRKRWFPVDNDIYIAIVYVYTVYKIRLES